MNTDSASPRPAGPMPWLVRGDIDGFFGLALDNFVQLLLIDQLCTHVLGFDGALLYGRVLPGVAVSLIVGNLFYAWQARKLSERSGRHDICALPYGINTVSLIGHVFLIMLPVKLAAEKAGLDAKVAADLAWKAGLVACLGSALIEAGGAFVAERIRKATPRAALLSTLAGIALTFIALGFLFRAFAHPVVGLATLGIVLLVYFGGVRFKGRIPGGLVAVASGALLAWLTIERPPGAVRPPFDPRLQLPVPVIGDLLEALRGGYLLQFLSVIVPMGVFNVVGSLQNIESAEAAGDSFPTRPSLLANGIGSFAAALFGSCFPTTIYIGHPGWKAMGARAGYSVLNAAVLTVVCLSGAFATLAWYVPVDAGMAIVLWIGIVITAQAFQTVPREHAAAVVVGLLPGVAAWGALLIKHALRVAEHPIGQENIEQLKADFVTKGGDTWIHGAFALEQGFIFAAMILSAVTVKIIERRFVAAACWCGVAAVLSLSGLMHSYKASGADTVISLTPAFQWAAGYGIMALVLLLAPLVTEPGEGH